jgi:Bacteriophage translational regulator
MNSVQDLVEIKLKDPGDFLKVKETLSRIGVASKKDKTLYQSCHILHKQQRYYIVHFKELFKLDGKSTDFDESDVQRRNTICTLLEEWGLVEIVNSTQVENTTTDLSQIKIVSFKEKSEWNLVAKYTIGKKKAP